MPAARKIQRGQEASVQHRRAQERERSRRYRERKRLESQRQRIEAGSIIAGLEPHNAAVDEFADWCQTKLKVPSGRLQAEPFIIEDWQLDFLRDALAPDIMESALSVSRKNGKSGLIAAVLLACLVGPWSRRGWRGIVCSLTGRLAGELLTAMESIAVASGLAGLNFKRTPYPGQINVPGQDTILDFLAADKSTGHAVGADIAVIDEAGLLEERQRGLWNAMLSAISGRDGRLMCISIRGECPMFSELIGRAAEPHVHVTEYAAPAHGALDDPHTWAAANPGLGTIKSAEYMRKAAARAVAIPADQAAFRAYDLNQPQVPDRVLIISISDWERCIADSQSDIPQRSGECCLGLDLGGSTSMTAAVAYWPRTSRFEAWGAFPANPDLAVRGEADAVGGLYERMRDRGELTTYPGRVTDVGRFLDDCAARLAGCKVLMVADRYRRQECLEAMGKAGVDWPVEWRGQGAGHTADGSRDVRAFQRVTLGGKWIGARSLMMEQAIAQSSLAFDGSGNAKIVRAKSTGRIDALQAGVLAAGLGERVAAHLSAGPRYRGLA